MARNCRDLSEAEVLALAITFRCLRRQDVAVELAAISYSRHHYMDTPLLPATLQVVVGGILVFLAGLLIGSS